MSKLRILDDVVALVGRVDRLAGAVGLLDAEIVATEADDLDRIAATLYKLAHRQR